jgi:hypothetical protein
MFGLLFAMLIDPPEALYTHVNLSNGNAASYPGPGYVLCEWYYANVLCEWCIEVCSLRNF